MTDFTENEIITQVYDYLANDEAESAVEWVSQVKNWDIAKSRCYIQDLIDKGEKQYVNFLIVSENDTIEENIDTSLAKNDVSIPISISPPKSSTISPLLYFVLGLYLTTLLLLGLFVKFIWSLLMAFWNHF